MLKSYKIDSFKIRIPMSECTLHEFSPLTTLPTFHMVDIETGEVDFSSKKRTKNFQYGIGSSQEKTINDEFPDRFLVPMKFSRAKVVTRRSVSKLTGKSHPIHEDCVLIHVNSKALRDRYFDGITSDTLPLVYDHIMNCDVVKFSYESFLKGKVTDIDICADYSPEIFQPSRIRQTIAKGVKLHHGNDAVRSWNTNGNKGIQMGSRDKCSIEKPFIKIYHKRIQMENSYEVVNGGVKWHRNKQFADVFLGGVQRIPKHLARLEFNLKDEKMMSHYLSDADTLFGGVNVSTLEYLVNVPSDVWGEIVMKMWSKWISLKIATPIKMMNGYEGSRQPWETMFICLLTLHWTTKGIPNTDRIAEIQALQLYKMALELSDIVEPRTTAFRRKNDVVMIASYVLNRMRNELSHKIESKLLQIQEYTHELNLLHDMKFPVGEVDWMIADELNSVGRLGIYDQLLDDDKNADWTNKPFDQEFIQSKGIEKT